MSGFCGSKDPLDDDEETTMIEEPKSDTIPAPPPVEEHFFDRLQREHAAWEDRNFPGNQPHQLLLGIVEEFGEYAEAPLGSLEEFDAVGDAAIFVVGYCTKLGLRMQDVYELACSGAHPRQAIVQLENQGPLCILARLCRCQLKIEQGIRGAPSEHVAEARLLLADLLTGLMGASNERPFLEIVADTWEKVRQRDWVAERARRQ